jgi:hypothetical protein
MSTRSLIGILTENNQVKNIYCHSDGYIDGNGVILFDHYNSKRLVEEMIDRGSMSYLSERVDLCKYYGVKGERDFESPQTYSLEKYASSADGMIEYSYLFVPGEDRWYVATCHEDELEGMTESETYKGFYPLEDFFDKAQE